MRTSLAPHPSVGRHHRDFQLPISNMATLGPAPKKTKVDPNAQAVKATGGNVIIQFQSATGDNTGEGFRRGVGNPIMACVEMLHGNLSNSVPLRDALPHGM